jgi:hypothetical protein
MFDKILYDLDVERLFRLYLALIGLLGKKNIPLRSFSWIKEKYKSFQNKRNIEKKYCDTALFPPWQEIGYVFWGTPVVVEY